MKFGFTFVTSAIAFVFTSMSRIFASVSFGKVTSRAIERGRSSGPVRCKHAAMARALRVVTIAAGVVMAAPAFAGTCTGKTGGSSDTLIWTGSGYTCAYVASNGNNSIASLAPDGWTSSTSNGYRRKAYSHNQSGGVTITDGPYTDGQGKAPSTMTFSAWNSQDGSRHWTGCVLWYASSDGNSPASSQYASSCSDNYNLPAILVYISKITLAGPASVTVGQPATYTVTVAAPDGGGPATGTVALYQSTISGKSPVKKNCDGSLASGSGTDKAIGQATLSNGTATVTTKFAAAGTSYVYAVYGGKPVTSTGMPSYCMTPPQRGLTPAMQDNTLMVAAK